MTNIEPAPEKPQSVEEVYNVPDHALLVLVATINAVSGMEVGITLYTSGGIISGLIVSGRYYFEELALQVGFKGPVGAALASGYRTIAEDYRSFERKNLDDPEDPAQRDQARTTYIHLRAATVHAPGTSTALEQGLWRGRLSAISGWGLVTFGPKPPIKDE